MKNKKSVDIPTETVEVMPVPQGGKADKLWELFKNRQVNVYGLTRKFSDCLERIPALPNTLTVRPKYDAIVASLDDILRNDNVKIEYLENNIISIT